VLLSILTTQLTYTTFNLIKNMSFSVEKMIQMIDLVRAHPCIWNKTLKLYKDIKNTNKVWKKISAILAVPDMDGKHCHCANNFSVGPNP